MKAHVYRCLYRAGLYLKAVINGLKEWGVHTPDTPLATVARPGGETLPSNRFFFIVVEVQKENEALILLMQTSPSAVAKEMQLPKGCRFRTCFEISPDYAEAIINI